MNCNFSFCYLYYCNSPKFSNACTLHFIWSKLLKNFSSSSRELLQKITRLPKVWANILVETNIGRRSPFLSSKWWLSINEKLKWELIKEKPMRHIKGDVHSSIDHMAAFSVFAFIYLLNYSLPYDGISIETSFMFAITVIIWWS